MHSVNETKKGLRFIYRLQRTVENGKSYILRNGEKTEIVDYGMLVSADAHVGNQRLDTKPAAAQDLNFVANAYVKLADGTYLYANEYATNYAAAK